MELSALQERTADRLMSTAIVQQLAKGTLNKGQYLAYMSDVYCYALHSAQVIGMAGVRLVASNPSLARYLFHHAQEELGHEKWAESDLIDLGSNPGDIPNIRPSPPCARMIGLEYYYAAHANPKGLFGWMFVLESLGGRIGGRIAQLIDKALALNGKGIYFLSGHAEADRHHSEDLFSIISSNITSREDREAFQLMANESEELYCAILDNAYGTL